MGKQRAHRRRKLYQKLVDGTLRGTPETGFRALIEANMRMLIIARTARFRCRCGALFQDYSGFPPQCAWVCAECRAIYRIEHTFDRKAFGNRSDLGLFDFCPIGEAVELLHLPKSDAADEIQIEVPVRTSREPTFACKLEGQPIHYEVGEPNPNAAPGQPTAVLNLVLQLDPGTREGKG